MILVTRSSVTCGGGGPGPKMIDVRMKKASICRGLVVSCRPSRLVPRSVGTVLYKRRDRQLPRIVSTSRSSGIFFF